MSRLCGLFGSASSSNTPPSDASFSEITQLIVSARQRAVQAVNTELIELHWQVGAYISHKIEAAEWGDGVVAQLATHLARTQPGLRDFTRPNLFRMRQFYEAYRHDAKVSALLRQLPWTQNLIILNQSKRPEEREFYLRMAIQEKWSSRELERQFKAALFERSVISPAKLSPLVRQMHPEALSVFKDTYMVEFLDLAQGHVEADLQGGLLRRLRDFLIELGRGFCVGSAVLPSGIELSGRPQPFTFAGIDLGISDSAAGQETVAGQAA